MADGVSMGLDEMTQRICRDHGSFPEITNMASVAESLLEAAAEKQTAHLAYPERRGAELKIIRQFLDRLEQAYAEELQVHENGAEITYELAPSL